MTKSFVAAFFLMGSFGMTASATSMQFCGQAGMAVFNSENVYECVVTSNTCETQEYFNNGWMPSANGQCPSKFNPMTICGWGGGIMQHPANPALTVNSLSTCETRALMEMGWVNFRSEVK